MPDSGILLENYAPDYNTLQFTQELYWSKFLEVWLETGDVLKYTSVSHKPSISIDALKDTSFEKIFSPLK